MTSNSNDLGKTVAALLPKQSEQDAAATPMDAVLDGARGGQFSGDRCFRLLARLWTLKRMMYYIYGGWAQGINLNEYPPAVAYLFGKQTHDEVKHGQLHADVLLRGGFIKREEELMDDPRANSTLT
jgi:hypothetical protein